MVSQHHRKVGVWVAILKALARYLVKALILLFVKVVTIDQLFIVNSLPWMQIGVTDSNFDLVAVNFIVNYLIKIKIVPFTKDYNLMFTMQTHFGTAVEVRTG